MQLTHWTDEKPGLRGQVTYPRPHSPQAAEPVFKIPHSKACIVSREQEEALREGSGWMRDRIKSYVPTATSSPIHRAASCPGQETALLLGSPLRQHTHCGKKLPCSQGPVSAQHQGAAHPVFPERCPLELCEDSALAAQLLYFSWCFFSEVLRGGTVISALGMLPALLRFKALICSGVFCFQLLPVLTDTAGGNQ